MTSLRNRKQKSVTARRDEWDGVKGKMGADSAESGRQPKVRSRVRSNRAMETRKWGPNNIGPWLIGSLEFI